MTKIITLFNEPVDSISPLEHGPAPDFTLTDLKGKRVTLSQLKKPVLISIFPDIQTDVCSLQTRYFNEQAARRNDIDFLSVSTNTPEQLKNWCAAEGVDMTILPDDGTFGNKYGVRMYDGPLAGKLARSVYVIKNGQIVHSQILSEISDEPNYEAALKAAS